MVVRWNGRNFCKTGELGQIVRGSTYGQDCQEDLASGWLGRPGGQGIQENLVVRMDMKT